MYQLEGQSGQLASNPLDAAIHNSRFSGCVSSNHNFNLHLLYQMADRFGFVVDVRGSFPTMIKGQRAARYTSHRDALDFISRTGESL